VHTGRNDSYASSHLMPFARVLQKQVPGRKGPFSNEEGSRDPNTRPRAANIGHLVALIFTCAIALPIYAATCETSSTATAVSPLGTKTPSAIVVGFLGGFVRRDERHHPEVRMIQHLRQEYPMDIYFGVFEKPQRRRQLTGPF